MFIQVESEKGGLCRLQTGMPSASIQVRSDKGKSVPFTLVSEDNGVIEIDMKAGDVVQVTDKTAKVVYPAPQEYAKNVDFYYGDIKNNK